MDLLTMKKLNKNSESDQLEDPENSSEDCTYIATVRKGHQSTSILSHCHGDRCFCQQDK